MAASFPVETTKESDQPLIEQLLDIAFGIERRVKTSYRLREGSTPADGLSLVVRDAEVGLAGSISFWPLVIGSTAERRARTTMGARQARKVGAAVGEGVCA